MHILADLEEPFKKYFLRCLDTDNGVIIDIFRINLEFVSKLKELKFDKLNSFLDNIQMDDNGNLSVLVEVASNIHEVELNYTHRPARGNGDRISNLKKEAEKLKDSIVKNLIENIEDQNQSGTLFEYASAFDLHRRIDLDARILYLRDLAKVYCKDYGKKIMFIM